MQEAPKPCDELRAILDVDLDQLRALVAQLRDSIQRRNKPDVWRAVLQTTEWFLALVDHEAPTIVAFWHAWHVYHAMLTGEFGGEVILRSIDCETFDKILGVFNAVGHPDSSDVPSYREWYDRWTGGPVDR